MIGRVFGPLIKNENTLHSNMACLAKVVSKGERIIVADYSSFKIISN
jgi:hypothetical protein